MSGDPSDVADGTVEVVSCTVVILEQLLTVGKQMVSKCVGFLLCQKVVHPVLQQYLQEQHVIVVDRLGAALLEHNYLIASKTKIKRRRHIAHKDLLLFIVNMLSSLYRPQ